MLGRKAESATTKLLRKFQSKVGCKEPIGRYDSLRYKPIGSLICGVQESRIRYSQWNERISRWVGESDSDWIRNYNWLDVRIETFDANGVLELRDEASTWTPPSDMLVGKSFLDVCLS
jgi:hypothetical protein